MVAKTLRIGLALVIVLALVVSVNAVTCQTPIERVMEMYLTFAGLVCFQSLLFGLLDRPSR